MILRRGGALTIGTLVVIKGVVLQVMKISSTLATPCWALEFTLQHQSRTGNPQVILLRADDLVEIELW